MGTIASKQASIFSRALTELDGKLDIKLDVKLQPLLAEQRRTGRQMDGVIKFFQVLAVVLPIFVALWIIDLQAGGAGKAASTVPPSVRGMFFAAVAAASLLLAVLYLRQQIARLWPWEEKQQMKQTRQPTITVVSE